jgi:hypothetical protein
MATLMTSIQSLEGDWNASAVVAVMLMLLALLGSALLAAGVQVIARLMARLP